MSNDINNSSNNNTENEHLLEYKWTLWFRPPTSNHSSSTQAKAWESSQKKYFEAGTVEEFWKGFHKLPRITPNHPANCDYSLFKVGIKPAWEDDFNKNGGRWTYSLDRRPHNSNQHISNIIEQAWLDVMLCLIGEGFHPHGDKIAGGVCGIRLPRGPAKNDTMVAKIHIWTKDAGDVEANTKIGETLKSVLRSGDGQLVYAPHDSNGKRGHGHGGNLKI